MRNKVRLVATVFAFLLVGCGGGGGAVQTPPPKPGTPIDPSGNWTMTALDSGGKSIQLAALFAQVGSVVTANSITASNDPAPFACTPAPFTAVLSNGLVQNTSNFTGDVTFGGGFGGFSFNTTLAPDGLSFTGTYSNMPACAGILPSGTFTGNELPSTTATWTGTLQACLYSQQTGLCSLVQNGATSTISMQLTQNDVTGTVVGTYAVTNLPDLTNGSVGVTGTTFPNFLSGTFWQFVTSDANPNPACAPYGPICAVSFTFGTLDTNRGFTGVMQPAVATRDANGNIPAYQLVMSH